MSVIAFLRVRCVGKDAWGLDDLLNFDGDEDVDAHCCSCRRYSNEIFISALRFSKELCVMVSEENEEAIIVEEHLQGRFVATFDPLDGEC